jgi:MSHA pilin protein MshC
MPQRGFTLVELVLVIVIAGILAIIAAPRFFQNTVYTQRGYADELAAALRLAQKVAVATDCPTRLTLSAGAYAVAQQAAAGNTCNSGDTTWSTPVVGLNGAAVQDSAPSGVVASPTGSFVFSGSGALTTSPATTLAIGSHTITIDAVTGLVTVL